MNIRERTILILVAAFFVTSVTIGQVPDINSISPQNGTIGTLVTMTGSNFDSTPENNVVFFGGVKATVISATAVQLEVEIPAGASSDFIFVNVGGLIAQSNSRFIITFDSDGSIGRMPDTFADEVTFTAGNEPYGLDVGDLDGDGLVDIATGNWTGENYSIFLNNTTGPGDISLASKSDIMANAHVNDIKLADLDGDGLLDIAAVSEDDLGTTYLEVERNITSTPGSISFTNEVSFAHDGYSYVLETADFNSDGKIDIVVFDSDNGVASVYENSSTIGSVNFEDDVDFTIGSDPFDLTIADFNADGLPDIVTLDGTAKIVSILENTSAGGVISFATKVDLTVNTVLFPRWLEAGDLNGDGLPDIVVDNGESISVFKNNTTAAITFSAPQEIPLAISSGPISMDDYNGDGIPDLILNGQINQLGVLKNTSSGSTISFDGIVKFSISLNHLPISYLSADLDSDGEPDIVSTTTGGTSYNVEVFRNHSSKNEITAFSFVEQIADATIDTAGKTIAINVDGVPDLTALTANFDLSSGATAQVAGTDQTSDVTSNDFTNPVTYTITAEDGSTTQDWVITVVLSCSDDVVNLTQVACEAFDFDGDLVRSTGTYTKLYTNVSGCDSTVTIDLTVHPIEFYDNIYTVGSYDFDGATLTTSGQYEYGPFTSMLTGCDSTLFLNLTIEPDTFDPQDYIQVQSQESTFPVIDRQGASHVADVDGDGEKDVFIIGKTSTSRTASLFINDGDGTYSEKTDHGIPVADVGNRSSLFLDANGDDALDFLLLGETGKDYFTKLFLNDGVGNFSEKIDHGITGIDDKALISYIDSADVDGDYDLDLIISLRDEFNSYQPSLWLNNGDGSFTLSNANDFPNVESSLADFADFDMDGDQDLLLRGEGLENKLWLNDGAGVFTQKIDQSLASVSSEGMLIFDMDGDGDMDIYDSNTKEFSNLYTAVYFNNGDGTFYYDLSSEMPRLDGKAGLTGILSKEVDFDNDGDLDLIMEGRYRYSGAPSLADYLDIWLNNGFGHFRPLLSNTLTTTFPADSQEFGRIYGYGNYQFNETLSVHDFDRDGYVDILLSGSDLFTTEDESRIFSIKKLSNELVVEECNSYDFDGTTLTVSGNYQGSYTDEYGTSFSVNLDLTINSCRHWSGTTDSDWFDATNWEEGSVPEITDNVIINVSGNDPVIIGDAVANDLTTVSGATVTIESGSALNIQGIVEGEGYAIVKRNTHGNKGYSIIGSMVEDAVVEDVEADYIYTFDGDDFVAPASSETMVAGKGYFAAFNEASPTVAFFGTLNSGAQSYNLPSADKFHLVANPYAAAVSHSELVSGNTSFDGTVYLWDDGGTNTAGRRDGVYVTVNAAGMATGTGGLQGKDAFNGSIGSGQGFFIYAEEATSVDFTPSMQSTDSGDNADAAYFRSAAPQYIRLSLSNEDYTDDLVVALQEGATHRFDDGLDARKLKNANLSFYSRTADQDLAIQAFSADFDEEVTISLAYETTVAGAFTLQLNKMQNFPSHLEIILEDTEKDVQYDLSIQDQLTVNLLEKSNERRFNLILRTSEILGIDHIRSELLVYGSPAYTKVFYPKASAKEEVMIYDLGGRVVYQNSVSFDFGTAILETRLMVEGIYLLHVGDMTSKFLLK